MVFGRRRTERAIARLTTTTRRLRAEITQLEQELHVVASEADQATVDAAVRPVGPVQREARRAGASRDNLQRLLADRRDQLATALADRDDLLEQLAGRSPRE